MKLISERPERPAPPPPLEADDQFVIRAGSAGWAIALVVLLIVRGSLPADERWWIWTCVAGLAFGIFALWYVPRLKRGRTRAAAGREPAGPDETGPDETGPDETGPDETGPDETGPDETGPDETGPAQTGPAQTGPQSAPRASGSNTVSSTETPGKSTRS